MTPPSPAPKPKTGVIALNIILDNELFRQKGCETFTAYSESLGVHYTTNYRWREQAKEWQRIIATGIVPPKQAASLKLLEDVPVAEVKTLLSNAKEIGQGKITGNAIKAAKVKLANAQAKIGAPATESAASDAFLKIRELNNAILANLGLDERLQVRAWIAAEHGPILSAESVIAHKHPENLERK